MNQFFIVDASTSCDRSVINPEVLLGKDLTMDLAGDEPKVLIYHTHSQETFADSVREMNMARSSGLAIH